MGSADSSDQVVSGCGYLEAAGDAIEGRAKSLRWEGGTRQKKGGERRSQSRGINGLVTRKARSGRRASEIDSTINRELRMAEAVGDSEQPGDRRTRDE